MGLLAAIINGAAVPGMIVLFGDLVQEMIIPYSAPDDSIGLANETIGVIEARNVNQEMSGEHFLLVLHQIFDVDGKYPTHFAFSLYFNCVLHDSGKIAITSLSSPNL